MADNPVNKTQLKDFMLAFLMPTFLGKALVLYFGIQYSAYPDEGYGYGLTLAIAWTVFSLVRMAWKYRNVEDL